MATGRDRARGAAPWRSLALFYALACGVTWALLAPLWLPALGVDALPVLPAHHALGALGPVAAAFWVTGRERGEAGVLALARSLVRLRGRAGWALFALLSPLAVVALAVVLAAVVEGEELHLGRIGVSREHPHLPLLAFLAWDVLTYGYGEETGWRGFLLPRLQARFSALGATLIVTVGWALWHAPMFLYRPGYASMGPADVAGWAFSLLTGAVLLTWLFNESGGSVLVVALFHGSVDVAFTSDIPSETAMTTTGALVVLWGLAVLAVAGPRALARAGRVVEPGLERAPAPARADPAPLGPARRDRAAGPGYALPMPHTLEPAASGRARCRGCGSAIAKGELRLGERLPNPFADEGEMTLWFHLACGAYKRPATFLAALAASDADVADRGRLEAAAAEGVEHRRLPRVDGAERAPSARAACRGCREKIAKGSWRIRLVFFEEGMFNPSGYVHAGCAADYLGSADLMDRLTHFRPDLGPDDRAELARALSAGPEPPA